MQQEQLIDGILFKIHPSAMFALSSCGKVLGRSGKVLRPKSQGVYMIVSYQADERKIRHKYVHRLVAETYLSNQGKLPFVNHIDGDKLNNCVSNLEWCTASGNTRYAIEKGLSWNLPKTGERGFQRRNNA